MGFRGNLSVWIVCLAPMGGSAIPLTGQGEEGGPSISYFRRLSGVPADDTHPLPADLGAEKVLVWRRPLAPGHSTPCLVGDRIFLTTHREMELATLALYADTGEIRWKRAAPVKEIEPVHRTGSPASCTPACDGERVYVFFGSYGLLCYDLEGQLLWSRKMGPFQDEFGANSSPVLADGLVILNEDHDIDSVLIALDSKTGKTVWKTERPGFTRSYSTPIIREVEGRKQVIVAGSRRLVGYDIRDGRQLWWVTGLARIVNPTPSQTGDMLYATGWTPGGDAGSRISMEPWQEARETYDKNGNAKISRDELPEGAVLTRFFRIDLDQDGGIDRAEWEAHARVFAEAQNTLLAIRPGGSGDVTSSRVAWIHRRGLPTVPSPLVYRGTVFLVKDGGIVSSLEAKTGTVIKQGRAAGGGSYYASPVAGDGKVYVASERGVVSVLSARGEWEILSSHDFGERIVTTPVIRGSRIYLRTDEALYCLER